MALKKYISNKKIQGFLFSRKEGFLLLFYNITSNVFTLLLNFSLPFYTDDTNYGYFVLVFSIVNFGAAFFTLGLNSTILKYSIDDSFEEKLLLTTLLSWVILSGPLLIFLILILQKIEISNILEISSKPFIISILSAALISFSRIGLYYYLGKRKSNLYGGLLIFNKVVQLIAVFVVAVFFQNDFIEFLPWAFMLQGFLMVTLFIVIEFRFFFNKDINFDLVKKMLKVSAPLSLNSFSTIGSGYGFNILISPLLSFSQLGILNIVTQFTNMYNLIINALNDGYIPKFHAEYLISAKSSVKNYLKYIFQNSILISILIMPTALIYMTLMGNVFESVSFVIILSFLISNFINSFKSIGLNILLLKEKTKYIFYITFVYSLLNLGLSFWLTNLFGLSGTFIGLSVSIIIQVYVLQYTGKRTFA